jgi:hypothetical protein
MIIFGECLLVFTSESFRLSFYLTCKDHHETIIFPIVLRLYACETWRVALKELFTLRKYENRVLKRIVAPTREEDTERWI